MAYKYTEYLTTALWGQGMFRKSNLEQITRCYNILNNRWLFRFEANECKYQTCYWSDRVSHLGCCIGLCYLHRNCAAQFSEKIDLVSFTWNTFSDMSYSLCCFTNVLELILEIFLFSYCILPAV